MHKATCLFVIVMNVFLGAAIAQSKLQTSPTPVIAQFFGIWGDHWQQKFRSDTPFNQLNRLYIAFGKIIQVNGHFSIAFDGSENRVEQIIEYTKLKNPTADIFLTVGGNGDASSYGGAANDAEFADNVATFLSEYGFNGFDIDWENNLNQKNLNQLVANLFYTLHLNHDKLTLDVWPYPDPAYNMTVLGKNVDQINIMSYGTTTSLSNSVNNYVQAGFSINKIIGGIETENGYPGGTDTLGPSGSIAEKAHYALQNNLAGMMEWRLDNDYATQDNPDYPTYQGAQELWAIMNNKTPRSN